MKGGSGVEAEKMGLEPDDFALYVYYDVSGSSGGLANRDESW